MKALIVDDERRARSELKRLLKAHAEIEVVGENASADDALAAIEKLWPDLLFLDIQMPGKNGFDLLAQIPDLPRGIFTTAYDEYALRAFEFHPFDYLLKPIEPKRLAQSLAHLNEHSPGSLPRSTPLSPRVFGENDQVFVKENERCWLVWIGEISVFESDGNYTRLFFGASRPLIYRSLNNLEARLDPRHFFSREPQAHHQPGEGGANRTVVQQQLDGASGRQSPDRDVAPAGSKISRAAQPLADARNRLKQAEPHPTVPSLFEEP
jgi:two-component system, LytTR family, response regulator